MSLYHGLHLLPLRAKLVAKCTEGPSIQATLPRSAIKRIASAAKTAPSKWR
jgi:hypothetical protein